MKKTVKCRYQHCLHETKDIPKEEAVGNGGFYYHADCYKEKQNKNKIVRIFIDNVNPEVSVPMLRRVINNIIHDKGISSEFLLFGLEYYINHKIGIKYPAGLYYVIENQDVKSIYKRIYGKKEKGYEFNIEHDTDDGFVYQQQKKRTIDNFMEG